MPRITGRAIASASDEDIREVQAYYFPEGDHSPEAQELVAAFIPTETSWPNLRVVIPPPEEDEKGNERVWDAIEQARAMELLDDPGAHDDANHDDNHGDDDDAELDDPDPDEDAEGDSEYGVPVRICAREVRAGDLIANDNHGWVVVESNEPDAIDEDAMAISWRSEDDDGLELVAAAEVVEVRHLEDTEES